MPDDKKAASAATVAAPVNQAEVESDISYIGARLREKSTYGGLAVALGFGVAVFHGHIDPSTTAGAIESIGLGVGALIGIFLPEKGSPTGKVNPLGMGVLAVMLAVAVRVFIACVVLAVVIGFSAPVFAQTAPVVTKSAPIFNAVRPASPFLTSSGAGLYIGLGTSASVASANVSGNVFAIPGITGGGMMAGNGTVDVDIGYIWGNCVLNTWCQIEADAMYTNIAGSNAVGSISTRWGFTQEFDVGADLVQTVLSALPGLGNPFPTFNPTSSLPANVAVAATPRGYFGFKQGEYLISGNVGVAGGQTWAYAPGVTAGFRWQTLGSNGKPNGGSLKIFADILWPTKGVSLSNVFGAGGAPIVTQPVATINNLYVAGLHYDFGL